jgi:HKD family nuclease
LNVQLVSNSTKNHGEVFKRGLSSAQHILVCTAFLKMSGLSIIRDSLIDAIRKGAAVDFIVGLDFYLTEPKALWDLFEIFSNKKNTSLFLCCRDKATFHPKLYYWATGKNATILVGSANLTFGGLESNFELSIMHNTSVNSNLSKKTLKYFSWLQKHERVEPASNIAISQYERKYKIFNKARICAEKEAIAESSNIVNIDSKKIIGYFEKYSKDKKEQADLLKKQSNYSKANNILENLQSGKISNKSEFLMSYELLVGSKNKSPLWHSGGLYRSKEKVAKNYKIFLAMLRDIKRNIKNQPEVVLEKGLDYVRRIDGLGPNVLTEIMNTYSPTKFAVLNKNPISTLSVLGFENFGTLNKGNLSGATYKRFNAIISEIANLCSFKNLSQVDHFLNYIYWRYVK